MSDRTGPLLILNRRGILLDLPAWFPRSRHELAVVTARSALGGLSPEQAAEAFLRLEVLDDYDSSALENAVRRLHAELKVTQILTTGEGEVLRAADLRAELGIPGQGVISARAYRDKYLMKSCVAAAGVDVAAMRLARDESELRDFAAAAGYPLVIKPVAGAASVGVHLLADEAALEAFLAREGVQGYLAEGFVPGDMYHVDGIMRDGEIVHGWPSRYLYSQWETMSLARPNISGMISRRHPLFRPLHEHTARAIAALPAPPGPCAFHAELFNPSEDRVVFCEIACRPGGGGIVETYERAFGVNLYRATLLGQAGRLGRLTVAEPATLFGWAFFPPGKGVLRHLPAACPLPCVRRFAARGKAGKRYSGPAFVTDRIAELSFVISGDDPRCELERIVDWWEGATAWSEAP